MPDLGTKHECSSCGVKFYDLGKSDPVCPKCEAPLGDEDENAKKKVGGRAAASKKAKKKAKKKASKKKT